MVRRGLWCAETCFCSDGSLSHHREQITSNYSGVYYRKRLVPPRKYRCPGNATTETPPWSRPINNLSKHHPLVPKPTPYNFPISVFRASALLRHPGYLHSPFQTITLFLFNRYNSSLPPSFHPFLVSNLRHFSFLKNLIRYHFFFFFEFQFSY